MTWLRDISWICIHTYVSCLQIDTGHMYMTIETIASSQSVKNQWISFHLSIIDLYLYVSGKAGHTVRTWTQR